ncbi:hypothetical protein M9458_052974 [Cirrhinus mrigala]|uniref:Uncharacterized protein n=1 Tax=Cirrhinus mrigala TaxID=683832 RepID=A0ABD0MNT6_CIRMR
MKQTWGRPGPQTSGGPPGHESPRRTTAGTTAAPTQKRAEEGPEGDHPAATMQTSQGAVAASPQAPPAAGHTRADRPWARRSKGPPPPSRGPAEPGGPGPAKQLPRAGQRSPEHLAPERETTNAPAAGCILHRHHYPQRGNQRQTPELNPLHSGVETGRPPRSPQQQRRPPAQTPTGWPARPHSPQPRTENREQGLQKTIDTQVKSVLRLYCRIRIHRRVKGPRTRAEPKRTHQPTLPAAHQPGPKPPRPSRNPSPVAERPQNPKPPPEQYGRQAGNLRPPAQASPAAPHAAARKTPPKSHQHPIQARTAAPAPNPPRNPPLGNSQMPPAHMAPPRRQQKPKPDRTVTPTHTR